MIGAVKIAGLAMAAASAFGGHNHHHHGGEYRFYDSSQVTAIPDGEASAVYSTGAWVAYPSQTRRLGHTIWIDVFGHNYDASALDTEPGDATPQQAGVWAAKRLYRHPGQVARLYMSKSEWYAVRVAVREHVPASQRWRVHYWVADPTGRPHIVPGAWATQWNWGPSVDSNLAHPGF